MKVGKDPKKRKQAYHQDSTKYGKSHITMKFREREKKDPIFARAAQLRRGIGQRVKNSILFNLDPRITTQFFYDLLLKQKKCECCQVEFDFSFKHNGILSNLSPSVDKIDNNENYTINNIAIICWRYNNLKRDATSKELQIIVNWMKRKGV